MQGRILTGDTLRTTSDLAEIRAAIAAKQPIWIELERQCDEGNALLKDLQIHPLTVEDIWATRSVPKLEDYDNYLYLIVHGIKSAKGERFALIELDVVI